MSLRPLLAGETRGVVVVLDEPLSMWGGLDPETGTVIDRRHPQCGTDLTGRIAVMPGGRGSSSSSSVLAEAIRRGTAPAAIVLREPDDISVIVVGGAGKHSSWQPTFGNGTRPTRRVIARGGRR